MAKVMISLPDTFLARVDRKARAEDRSRSEVIREALRAFLGPPPRPALLERGAPPSPGARRPLDRRVGLDAGYSILPRDEAWPGRSSLTRPS